MTTQLKAAIEAAASAIWDRAECCTIEQIREIITRHIEPVVSAMQAELQKSIADSVEHCQDGWRQAAMLSDEIERLKNGS